MRVDKSPVWRWRLLKLGIRIHKPFINRAIRVVSRKIGHKIEIKIIKVGSKETCSQEQARRHHLLAVRSHNNLLIRTAGTMIVKKKQAMISDKLRASNDFK